MIDRETAIKIAKQSGAIFDGSNWKLNCEIDDDDFMRFVSAVTQKAVETANKRAADIVRDKAMKMEREAQGADAEDDGDSATSLRATAWVLITCESDIRARSTGGAQ